MKLTEQHIITNNHPSYAFLTHETHLSKNLYNATLYLMRQDYFDKKPIRSWIDIINEFTATNNPDYRALPSKIAKQTIKKAGSDLHSFFGLLKLKNKGNYNKQVKLPKYKKTNGHTLLEYPKESISRKIKTVKTKKGDLFLHTACTNDPTHKFQFYSQHETISSARIIPKNNHFIIEVIRDEEDTPPKEDNGKYASIDIGLNNLAAVFYNFNEPSSLVNGRHLKSINQYYNKEVSSVKSSLEKCNNRKKSNRLSRLVNKRNNKIRSELHEVSSLLVNHLVSLDISKVIIGKNDNWKQDINIGSRNNQNFVSVPHAKFIDMLTYKLARHGIEVVLTEESYTSKCSALDREKICSHGSYAGSRVRRGLFRTSRGVLMNADVNGAVNIMRKVVPDEEVFLRG